MNLNQLIQTTKLTNGRFTTTILQVQNVIIVYHSDTTTSQNRVQKIEI